MAQVFKLRNLSLVSPKLFKRVAGCTSCPNSTRNCASVSAGPIVAVQLKHRSLLHIDGKDSKHFLQGLITNDIEQLSTGSHSLYAMFLNTKGRVMYDTLFYQNAETNDIFLECDTSVANALEKHLKTYRLRKNVGIRLKPDIDIWAAFNPQSVKFDWNHLTNKNEKTEKGITPCDIVVAQQNKESSLDLTALTSCNVVLYRDPRLSLLGVRVLCPKNENVACLLQLSLDNDITHYHTLRYKLGIGEGVTDLPPGECFPLESNCDYLNGISFHKGCYIGQELTARVHHTGVVRKRLMPIILEKPLKSSDVSSLQILDSQDKVVGKIRSVHGTNGIALLRLSEALNATSLHVEGIKAYTKVPPWWPCQAIKEADLKVSS